MLPNRRSIRLRNFDYSRNGYYFITICTSNKKCLFGTIKNGRMHRNDLGNIVMCEWNKTVELRGNVQLDESTVMPNHFHGILVIQETSGTARRAPTRENFSSPVSGSIPSIVRSFKSATCRAINQLRKSPGKPVWQRNYWEHVIRNEIQLNAIREYISNNPSQWELDRLYPGNADARW